MEEKEFPRNYSNDVVEVLNALSLTGDGKDINVVGSGSLRNIQFAGDYDSNVVTLKSHAVVARQMAGVIKRLRKIPRLVIGDIKVGESKGEPIHWTPRQIIEGQKGSLKLADAIASGGRTKIDTIAIVDDSRYVEITCVYMVGKQQGLTKTDYLENITQDIKSYLNDGNYWKALKRLFSIARLNGEKRRIERLVPVFNGDLGRLYSVLSDIRILIYLLEEGRGSKAVISAEIDGFRSRLSNIWSLPDFIKAEPTFDKDLMTAVESPGKTIQVLRRLEASFNKLLQNEAKPIFKKEIRR